MKSLKELLLNHKIPGTKQLETRRLCAQAASEVLEMPIPASEINYKDGCVSFLTTPVIKTEIILQKEEIVKKIKGLGVSVVSLR